MLEEEIQNYYEDIQELQNNYMKNQMIYQVQAMKPLISDRQIHALTN